MKTTAKNPETARKKTGTREWAEHSVNVCVGCRHGCLYCYAAEMAARFKNRDRDEWPREQVNWSRVDPLKDKKFAGRVMFPTSHDWTAGNSTACALALGYLLAAGNDVLLVSKSGPPFVHRAWRTWSLQGYPFGTLMPEIRMSVTCLDESVRRFWEPNAAPIAERIEALRVARNFGLPTSVAIEPLLEPERAVEIVETVADLCVADDHFRGGYNGVSAAHGRGGQIWIGKGNGLSRRTAWALGRVEGLKAAVRALETGQTDEAVLAVVEALADHPQVRWKDSYLDVIQRHEQPFDPPMAGSLRV